MRWIFLLIGIGTLPLAGLAQPDRLDRAFDRGTAAYRQGQYDRAVTHYRAVLDTGYASAALYYNLGTAYARLERPGPAIRYYEKARRLRPDDARLRHNLEQVRRRAGVYPEPLGEGSPRLLGALVRGWSPLVLFGAGLLLVGGGLVAAVWGARPRRPDPWRRPHVRGLLGGGLLLVLGALGTSYAQSLDRRAVVVASEAPVRARPAPEAASDTTLPEGRMVEMGDRRGQWQEVRLADGTTGWVPVRALGDV
jgi:tetratricopeptide (TPR) repeat protein